MEESLKFIIATGGSGGHILPALYTAKELKKEGHQIAFVGVFKSFRAQIVTEGFSAAELSAQGLKTQSVKSLFVSCWCMTKSFFEAFKILRHNRPDAVIGFGGYGAFPVMFVAVLLRYPTMIHEQNVLPGRANKLLSKVVKRIALSFEASEKYFPAQKIVLTGCPCHPIDNPVDKAALQKKYNLEADLLTLLILGGSQGSRRINQEVIAAVPLLKGFMNFQVIHVCGEQDFADLEKKYQELGMRFCLFPFLENMIEAYQLADLVVSRAGAVTVTEIAGFALPSILIPYPHAGAHQKKNALQLQERKAAEIIEEADLSSGHLADMIKKILSQPSIREMIQEIRFKIYRSGAAQTIAKEAVRLVKK